MAIDLGARSFPFIIITIAIIFGFIEPELGAGSSERLISHLYLIEYTTLRVCVGPRAAVRAPQETNREAKT